MLIAKMNILFTVVLLISTNIKFAQEFVLTMTLKFDLHIPVTLAQNQTINVLKKACAQHPLSTNQIKSAVNKGALWLTTGKRTTRLRKIKKALKQGDTLHFYYDEKVLNQVPAPAILIADNQGYSIWFKPYGMLSQGSKWSDHCTIARFAETNLYPQRPAFVVHRLDRAASGLIIIAHSKKIAQKFSYIFEHHQLEKQYQIIVQGLMSEEFDNEHGNVVDTPVDNKHALSTFYPIEHNEQAKLSLINVQIKTGRKHQIRKHAASIGFPVVGDRLHGDVSQLWSDDVNLQLCAVSLSFNCPITDSRQHFSLPASLRPNLTKLIAEKNA